MTISLNHKKDQVKNINLLAEKTISMVAVEYSGISVNDMTALRKQGRDQGVQIKVVRNTLAKRAFENTPLSCAVDELKGPLFLAFSIDLPGAAAKLIKEFVANKKNAKTKFLVLENKLLSANNIDKIAKLPTYDEALSTFMRTLLAPVEKFVRTLAEPNSKLARTIGAYKEKLEKN